MYVCIALACRTTRGEAPLRKCKGSGSRLRFEFGFRFRFGFQCGLYSGHDLVLAFMCIHVYSGHNLVLAFMIGGQRCWHSS